MNNPRRGLILLAFLLSVLNLPAQTAADSSKDLLGKAIEYFAGQKYQEALLTFAQLEKTHRLSTRMQAYKGICLYKTNEYEQAIETLQPVAPQMDKFSPHEQAVCYYACGESYFQLGRYFECVPIFEKALGVFDNAPTESNSSDRAEICYRLGFAQMFCAEYEDAIMWLTEAEKHYALAESDDLTRAHRAQARRMLNALKAKHEKKP